MCSIRLLLLVFAVTRVFAQNTSYANFPVAKPKGPWVSAYAKARDFVSKLTIEEKVSLTIGVNTTSHSCAGTIPSIDRLGFPGLCLHDGPNGVKATDLVNGYPAAVHVGASWNKELARKRGYFMNEEFKKKGVHVALGPAIGALGRVVSGGRNPDSFSVDPYLCGSLGAKTVEGGIEVGVITGVKHYIANEQETNRYTVSSNIDDKTLHELYLWPFQDAVKAGTANIMCSYNLVNNTPACGNGKTQNDILKNELAFPGFIVSDWNGQQSFDDANNGLDMAMPNSPLYWQPQLLPALRNGSFSERRLNDMVTRIIASWYYAGQDQGFPAPGVGLPFDIRAPHPRINGKNPQSKSTLLTGAVEGHVLVKNVKNTLPLKSPQILNLYGYDGKSSDIFNPWGTPLGWSVGYSNWERLKIINWYLSGYTSELPSIAGNGTLFATAGSGAITPGYVSSPFEALTQKAYEDGTHLYWDFVSSQPGVVAENDACLVFINAAGTETGDRPSINDPYSNDLIHHVADRCSNTIVIIHNAWIRLVDSFVDHPNVTSIVYAHLPGQDSGRALVSLLYGEENFSGKLPYTVAKTEADYGHLLHPDKPGVNEPNSLALVESSFSEGSYIDYRAFEANNITARYEFGFGLSYTTFRYSTLKIERIGDSDISSLARGPLEPGGRADLWKTLATVSFNVQNTGKVSGKEAVQLYIQRPDGTKWLRGFEKVPLEPGKSTKVSLSLTRRDLSEWDIVSQQWRLTKGNIKVLVGASSKDLQLNGALSF